MPSAPSPSAGRGFRFECSLSVKKPDVLGQPFSWTSTEHTHFILSDFHTGSLYPSVLYHTGIKPGLTTKTKKAKLQLLVLGFFSPFDVGPCTPGLKLTTYPEMRVASPFLYTRDSGTTGMYVSTPSPSSQFNLLYWPMEAAYFSLFPLSSSHFSILYPLLYVPKDQWNSRNWCPEGGAWAKWHCVHPLECHCLFTPHAHHSQSCSCSQTVSLDAITRVFLQVPWQPLLKSYSLKQASIRLSESHFLLVGPDTLISSLPLSNPEKFLPFIFQLDAFKFFSWICRLFLEHRLYLSYFFFVGMNTVCDNPILSYIVESLYFDGNYNLHRLF